MNKSKEVEVVDLLEDIIGELSGSYVTGTGKDGIPKRLFQVHDYLNGKKTDAKECIFSSTQLKMIADNKKGGTGFMTLQTVHNIPGIFAWPIVKCKRYHWLCRIDTVRIIIRQHRIGSRFFFIHWHLYNGLLRCALFINGFAASS